MRVARKFGHVVGIKGVADTTRCSEHVQNLGAMDVATQPAFGSGGAHRPPDLRIGLYVARKIEIPANFAH